MKKLPVHCPSCQALLKVSALSCTRCDTAIHGDFDLPLLARLPEEDQEFILAFIRAGGSLKAMARQMKKSYPTVRNILDDIINRLETQTL